jgi:3-hydroxypropanoate dehydrogenase
METTVESPSLDARSAALSLDRILYPARRAPLWAGRAIARERFNELHALMSISPSMVDASPTQLQFVASTRDRNRLAPYLAPASRDETLASPACAMVGYNVDFAELLVEFLPRARSQSVTSDGPEVARQAAMRSGGLQGAYFILAARAVGLEATEVTEFDARGLAFEFFPKSQVQVTFLCALGYPSERGSDRACTD